jgi:biotin operon repressor
VKAGPARVLDALRRAGGRTCSGATLSEELEVSRAQVWKHVETLRALGYKI